MAFLLSASASLVGLRVPIESLRVAWRVGWQKRTDSINLTQDQLIASDLHSLKQDP